MKKVIITIAVLLASCNTHQDIIYSSKNVYKSIKNLETMREWIEYDTRNNKMESGHKEHYYLLINQTIYNLQRNIKPKRPIRDYSGMLNLLEEEIKSLEYYIHYSGHIGLIDQIPCKEMENDLRMIKETIDNLKQ